MNKAIPAGGQGFTFIELLLYVGIIALVMGSLVPAAWEMIGGQAKSNSNSEMYAQMRKISDRIKYEIRNASGITTVTATSISLASATAANNPTVIDQAGQFLRIKQGAGPTVNLNSPDNTISGLIFTDYTSGDNKTKNIQFVFTLSQNYPSGRQEFVGFTTVEGDAEIRSN